MANSIVLDNERGFKVKCDLVEGIEHKGKHYAAAFVEAQSEDVPECLGIFEVMPDPRDQSGANAIFIPVQDDEEGQKIYDMFLQKFK